jgi:hypothetical protein
MTSSTLLSLFRRFAFLVGDSLNGDFLNVSLDNLNKRDYAYHRRPLDREDVALNAPNIML